KVARALELGREGSADPQVERLIESFAFLTARIQRELDANFPVVPSALLSVLYPHLTAPVPSLSIAQFRPDPNHGRALMGVEVPRHTRLFAQAADDVTCRFRSCYPVTLWPLTVADADIRRTAAYPFLDNSSEVAAVLRLKLDCLGKRSFAEFQPESLRLFIDADTAQATQIYEMLMNRMAGIAVLPEGASQPTAILPPSSIRPVGFAADESVLPHPVTAHQGYRLLQEYFVFPEKYLFLDVAGLAGHLGDGRSCELVFLLEARPRAGLVLGRDNFRLGCTPIVNLFTRTSEPLRLDHTQPEYRLMPDVRWERATEIHTILKVSATSAPEDDSQVIQPLFSYTHGQPKASVFWMARRRDTGRDDLPGTDVLLSFKDLGLRPGLPDSKVVFAHVLCTNRGIAEEMPAGTPLEMELSAPAAGISALRRPTRQLSPPPEGEGLWRLVSHLSLNHLSLAGGPRKPGRPEGNPAPLCLRRRRPPADRRLGRAGDPPGGAPHRRRCLARLLPGHRGHPDLGRNARGRRLVLPVHRRPGPFPRALRRRQHLHPAGGEKPPARPRVDLMAPPVRRSDRPLIERLAAEPQRFDFNQALAILEAAAPGCVPVGEGRDPAREAVRLRGWIGREFPASDVADFKPATKGEPQELTVAFLSLAGAFGPLPPPMSELVLERHRRHDDANRDFLDVFNHRLLSIWARAKRTHVPTLQKGRPDETGFAAMVMALLGLGTEGLRTSLDREARSRLHGFERALLEPAALMNQRPVSLHAVEALVAHYLSLPVKGTPLVGRWLNLEADQTTVIGKGGRNAVLGQGAVLGTKVWDQAAAIRLEIGPLTLGRMIGLLPGGDANRAVHTLLGYALGGSTDVEMKLVMPPRQVPPTRLTANRKRRPARLGQTSWLTTRPRKEPGIVTLRLGAPGS
ncbi:MAG TPA: type VI secretion system baseplate subunit TssF, partial [Candidatus Omnitrophota bacterium]|nr:type VI secretion system baseplate subunit TssF [Candidatus Omnitrophota bacterium]